MNWKASIHPDLIISRGTTKKIKAAESMLSQYKLVFALLLNYDKHCNATNQLQYFVYKNIVVVFGKNNGTKKSLQ